MILIQPQGLTVTGVTTWAVRLASAMARAGRRVGLVVHGGADGHRDLAAAIDPAVRVFRFHDLPPIEQLNGDVTPIAGAYASAVRALDADAPVALVPTRHGDCFGACAHLTTVMPDRVRLIGWQHSPSAYESAVLARYEPVCARLVAVSAFLAGTLRARFPHRAADVVHAPNAVVAPIDPPARPPLAGRPVRLIYTGRLEHELKRVGALVAMSDALVARAVPHGLTLLGDGPAAPDIDALARSRPAIRRLDPVAPEEVAPHLDAADAFVLASRTEGLSVAVLEAMARACPPIITATESGSAEAVVDAVSGLLVPFADEDDAGVGVLLADALERALAIGLPRLGAAAHARARAEFGFDRLVERTGAVIDAAGAADPRVWSNGSPAFSAAPNSGSSGSVPAGAAERLARLLATLAGRRILVHGTGEHTRQLLPVFDAAPVEIVAWLDDDPTKAGSRKWGRPVLTPDQGAATGATDMVISSWMHESPIWSRRAPLELAGVRVHRLYADADDEDSAAAA